MCVSLCVCVSVCVCLCVFREISLLPHNRTYSPSAFCPITGRWTYSPCCAPSPSRTYSLCCAPSPRASTSRPLITIRASSIQTRPEDLDPDTGLLHTDMKYRSVPSRSAHCSLLRTHKPGPTAPSVPGPCAGAATMRLMLTISSTSTSPS